MSRVVEPDGGIDQPLDNIPLVIDGKLDGDPWQLRPMAVSPEPCCQLAIMQERSSLVPEIQEGEQRAVDSIQEQQTEAGEIEGPGHPQEESHDDLRLAN
jgi:hypothetical protein